MHLLGGNLSQLQKINSSSLQLGMRFSAPVFFDDKENIFLAEGKEIRKFHLQALIRWNIDYVFTYGQILMKNQDISDVNELSKVEELESLEEVDDLDKEYRHSHMLRLNKHICSIDSGIIYLDLLTNIERISDHSASIAKRVIKVDEW